MPGPTQLVLGGSVVGGEDRGLDPRGARVLVFGGLSGSGQTTVIEQIAAITLWLKLIVGSLSEDTESQAMVRRAFAGTGLPLDFDAVVDLCRRGVRFPEPCGILNTGYYYRAAAQWVRGRGIVQRDFGQTDALTKAERDAAILALVEVQIDLNLQHWRQPDWLARIKPLSVTGRASGGADGQDDSVIDLTAAVESGKSDPLALALAAVPQIRRYVSGLTLAVVEGQFHQGRVLLVAGRDEGVLLRPRQGFWGVINFHLTAEPGIVAQRRPDAREVWRQGQEAIRQRLWTLPGGGSLFGPVDGSLNLDTGVLGPEAAACAALYRAGLIPAEAIGPSKDAREQLEAVFGPDYATAIKRPRPAAESGSLLEDMYVRAVTALRRARADEWFDPFLRCGASGRRRTHYVPLEINTDGTAAVSPDELYSWIVDCVAPEDEVGVRHIELADFGILLPISQHGILVGAMMLVWEGCRASLYRTAVSPALSDGFALVPWAPPPSKGPLAVIARRLADVSPSMDRTLDADLSRLAALAEVAAERSNFAAAVGLYKQILSSGHPAWRSSAGIMAGDALQADGLTMDALAAYSEAMKVANSDRDVFSYLKAAGSAIVLCHREGHLGYRDRIAREFVARSADQFFRCRAPDEYRWDDWMRAVMEGHPRYSPSSELELEAIIVAVKAVLERGTQLTDL